MNEPRVKFRIAYDFDIGVGQSFVEAWKASVGVDGMRRAMLVNLGEHVLTAGEEHGEAVVLSAALDGEQYI